MLKPCLFLALATLSTIANADLGGVWQGTLGKTPITACFNAAPNTGGSYYYQRFLTPIQLTQETPDAPWVEEGNSGVWQLEMPQGESLKGVWSKTKGSNPLPLALQRVATPPEGCASDAYNTPMETSPLPVKTQKQSFAGHSYQIKTQGAQVTLKLEGDSPAIQKINRQLASLAVSAEDQANYFSERREYLGRNGAAYTSEISVEPTYWSSQWITVRFYRWAAGTGARGISWGLHSWNLQTGESVDPWTWLGGHQEWYDAYSGHLKLPVNFSAWLEKQTTTDEGCPAITSYSSFDLSFDTQGMKLSTPANGDGCDNDLSFTWEQLEPVLSAKGKAALASLKMP
ncbi:MULTISPECIES: hypothetical protein [unclassified Pseudomonas]|uniref:hypothetical protein n=1 Tax=unclassified Pseudomonas TaxID=196821 RepID=UPI000C86D9F2|nr:MULTISPECIES: hypothetical protein [unclassified Pseudomonas]PMU26409.1 hypothetical protein C1X90_06615 [Pseudomonas sp. GP01-A9]PMU31524.1 hypothetical protein C1X88_05060 [Pseudomonas sp. GP01-A13]PMU43647.1 hypothetical protein C1X89_06230 [Pseudomonas sp. GP01-A8]PMU55556.1 hypothetical protein C1X87_03550 [Pseudomonas sp. GP01-A14]PMU56482.1 hypothetical protein C1X85_06945 [Pseudomonas sp. GP01-A6]